MSVCSVCSVAVARCRDCATASKRSLGTSALHCTALHCTALHWQDNTKMITPVCCKNNDAGAQKPSQSLAIFGSDLAL